MSEIIFLTQPFKRPYIVRQYLQSRNIPVNKKTEMQVNYLIDAYQARTPIIKDDLYNFLDRSNIT